MPEDVSLTYDGGWKLLNDVFYEIKTANFELKVSNALKLFQIVLLVLILMRLWK